MTPGLAAKTPRTPPLTAAKSRPSSRQKKPSSSQPALQRLSDHLHRLWDHYSVPEWHRKLYAEKYCTGNYRPEVLMREAKALVEGEADVQRVQDAIGIREEVLLSLCLLRGGFSDEDFCKVGSTARVHLSEQLHSLRLATIEAVHALASWRRSVAPPPSHASVGGPSSRGARWPCQWDNGVEWEDYLFYVVRDDKVVRSFAPILELAPEVDPLLLYGAVGGLGPQQKGKLCPPSFDVVHSSRLEEARMILLEEEVALTVFTPTPPPQQKQQQPPCTERPPSRSSCGTPASQRPPSTARAWTPSSDRPSSRSSTRLVQALTAPLELPPLQRPAPPGLPRARPKGRPAVPRRPRSSVERQRPTAVGEQFRRGISGETQTSFASTDRGCEAQLESQMAAPVVKQISAASSKGIRRQVSQASSQDTTPEMDRQISGPNMVRQISGPNMVRQISGPNMVRRLSSGNGNGPNLLYLPGKSGGPGLLGNRSSGIPSINGNRLSAVDNSSDSGGRGSPSDSRDFGGVMEDPPAAVVKPRLVGIDTARVKSAWNRFESDMMLHHDDMPMALQRVGFVRPNKAWLEESFQQVTLFNGVNEDEFLSVIEYYDQRQRAAFEQEFNRFDGGDGEMDCDEFAKLLKSLGIEPLTHVLEECMDEVDDDGTGCLNFDEFYKVMNLLAQREGFSKSEFNHLEETFKKFDKQRKGEIEVKELAQVLTYLGHQSSMEDCRKVAEQVDLDGAGTIDLQEFLMCMRIFRDRELSALKKDFEAFDEAQKGSINMTALPPLLQRGGYLADEDVVIEVLGEIGMNVQYPEDVNLDISSLWQFLVLYRSREGLCKRDAASVRKAFATHAVRADDGTEPEVSTADLPRILRSIGYSMPLEDQKRITAQVDIDRSGALGSGELLKMIRFCREQRSKHIQAKFHEFDKDGRGHLSVEDALDALKALNCVREKVVFPPPLLAAELKDGVIELLPFMRCARRMDDQIRRQLRESGGYSWEELENLRSKFDKFDADGSGDVQKEELAALLLDIFPGMADDPAKRPQLLSILKESDKNSNGCLDFAEFLILMQKVEDVGHQIQLAKERQVVMETGFSMQEVSDFREVFLDRTGGKAGIPFQVFKDLISPVCPMGAKNSQDILNLWNDIIPAVRNEIADADFPDFLAVMRRVLDTDFGDVHERSKQRIERARMKG
eukprot:gb/GFBE01056144.1/.p1 GENE.gb/GFBE01056144.1/~~gb/GFBE01056144.1/.p1  ORF type:complete len:1182 (+),score=250.71 gb/GFBE01056144.1/:1-3546(+)